MACEDFEWIYNLQWLEKVALPWSLILKTWIVSHQQLMNLIAAAHLRLLFLLASKVVYPRPEVCMSYSNALYVPIQCTLLFIRFLSSTFMIGFEAIFPYSLLVHPYRLLCKALVMWCRWYASLLMRKFVSFHHMF